MSNGREGKRNIEAAGEPIKSSNGSRVLCYIKDGKIYLQESENDADTSIHENIHMWDEVK